MANLPDSTGAHDPFDLPDAQWQALAPKYALVLELTLGLTLGLPAIAAAVAGGVLDLAWLKFAAGAIVIVWVVQAILIPRRVRAVAYACRAEDVAIRRGIWRRTLVVVPYGRMQTVSVSSGPLLRRFGLASLELQTASAGSNATIPGIARAEADRLRDQLTALGEERMLRL